jgi:hypothetical protein
MKAKVADEVINRHLMNVGQVNDEGVPLDTEVNTKLTRVCGLAPWQRVSLTLQGFDELTKNEKDELFKNSIQAYVQYPEELKQNGKKGSYEDHLSSLEELQE